MPILNVVSLLLLLGSSIVSGNVSAVGADGAPFMMPGATVSVIAADGQVVSSSVTDDQGNFRFADVGPGTYTLKGEMPGFRTFEKRMSIADGVSILQQIRLELAGVTEDVQVTAETPLLETKEASASAVVAQQAIASVPLRNEQFIDTLPLIPGVVRGPDGLINIKGGRSSQSDLRVNASSAADPVTGEYGFRLPIDAIESVQTLTNPYSAEFGDFSSGVTRIQTRTGQDKFHFQLQNFFPRTRTRGGSIVGLESATPRMTFSGPAIPGKLHYLQSLEYRFIRTRVPVDDLPDLKDDTILESFDSFTQLDYEINAFHHLSTQFSVFPQKNGFVGLNTFNVEETTHDFRQGGFLFAISERAILGRSLLESTYSVKSSDATVRANGSGIMFLAPERNFGGFFNRQDRDSTLHQWSSTYSFAPVQAQGRHALRVGTEIKYNTFTGLNVSRPVEILSGGGKLLERIDFTGEGRLRRNKTDIGVFAQDSWDAVSGLILQFGVRYDRDSAIDDANNVAPRFGFAFSRLNDGRTLIRGGIGLFYNRVPINTTVFHQMQQRVITAFGADGSAQTGPVLYSNALSPDGLRRPYAASANVEIGHRITENLVLRAGVQQRNGRREFILEPEEEAISALVLDNRGSSRYREFNITSSYRLGPAHELLFSYVRSRAIGDLNDFNAFYGNDPRPIIRPNERSLLPFDAPHRFLFWGTLGLPKKVTIAPVLEVRSGFPYSEVDEHLRFIGPRNRAGRYPSFASLDLQILKTLKKLPFLGKSGQVGIKLFNILDHFNPRDVQNNLSSANFGAFSNSIGTRIRMKFTVNY